MRTTLSSTILTTGPQQNLLVKDVYDVTGETGNTSVRDVLAGLQDETVNAMRRNPSAAAQLTELVLQAKMGRMTNDMAMTRLGNILGARYGLLDAMASGVTRTMAAAIGMTPQLADQVMISVRNGMQQYPQGIYRIRNMSSAQGMTSVLQQILNDRDVVQSTDIQAEVALLSGVLNESIKAGIPGSIDMMMSQASNDLSRRYIASQNMGAAIYSGNIDTMESMTNHIAAESIMSNYPTFARDFLGHFTLQPADTPNTYASLKQRILSLYRRVDPHWDITYRNGVPMPSLAPFTQASDDAKRVFLTTPEYRAAISIASSYSSLDIGTWVGRNYPYYPGA